MRSDENEAAANVTGRGANYLYVGGGFPRASQCITTLLSRPSNGKITSSGSWRKIGPNSSLSKQKRREGKSEGEGEKKGRIMAMISAGGPLAFCNLFTRDCSRGLSVSPNQDDKSKQATCEGITIGQLLFITQRSNLVFDKYKCW